MARRGVYLPPPSLVDACSQLDVVRLASRVLLAVLIVSAIAAVALPWQQSVSAGGRVVAFDPVEREYTVMAPIKGRLAAWHVMEGDTVVKGQILAVISDNDPNYLQRLEAQVEAAGLRLRAVEASIEVVRSEVRSLEAMRKAAIDNATLNIGIAGDGLEGIRRDVDAAKADYEAARLQLSRIQTLRDKQLVSQRDLELAIASEETKKNKLLEAQAKMRAANRKVSASHAKRTQVSSKDAATVEKARSSLEKLRSDRAKVLEDIQKLEVKAARQRSMRIESPVNGTVRSITARVGVEFVKQGDRLAMLVPTTEARAVEVWVDGNDAPLVTPGREVRIQFEGWPAVQFVGWPSVAVGTFAGKVAVVDASGDDQGRFRVLAVPDPKAEEPWPESRFLRQGARARAWILLNEVSVAYELWRQVNGFPPIVQKPGTEKGMSAGEKGKK